MALPMYLLSILSERSNLSAALIRSQCLSAPSISTRVSIASSLRDIVVPVIVVNMFRIVINPDICIPVLILRFECAIYNFDACYWHWATRMTTRDDLHFMPARTRIDDETRPHRRI